MKPLYVILIVITNLYIKDCYASHSSMCLGLNVEGGSTDGDYQSLGIKKVFPMDVWDYFKFPIEKYKTVQEIAPDRPSIALYSVQVTRGQEKEKDLTGWLKVHVDMKESLGFVICAHDENKQPLGQFSDIEYPQFCGPRGLPNVKYNIIPCGGVPAFEPEVPNCLVYIHPSLGSWNTSSPIYGNPSSKYDQLVFFWHFSQQICNLKEMIHFRGYFIQKREVKAIYHPLFRDIYIKKNAAFGAADPPPKSSDISKCYHLVKPNDPPWVEKIEGELKNWTWIYGQPFTNFEDKTGCQSNYFGGRCVKVISGKRGHFNEMETPDQGNLPKCQTAIEPDNKPEDYSAYKQKMINKCQYCAEEGVTETISPTSTNTPIPVPNQHKPSERPQTKNDKVSGPLHVDTELGLLIWGLRKGHAVCMIILTIFLTPVSILLARYFKESYMNVRIVNLHIWYFAHIHISPLSLVFIVVGMICVLLPGCYIGKSRTMAALVHAIGGWISIVLFICLTAFGGLRTRSMLSVCTHWFFGTCFDFFCYLLLWNSAYIPGSPIADFDVSVHAKEKDFNLVFGYLIGWITVDLTVHVIMTLVMKSTDSSMRLSSKRFNVPPPIPVIHKDTKVDVPGTGFRTICLCIHGAISLIITFVMCVSVLRAREVDRTFGPMSCTHTDVTSTVLSMQEDCWYPTLSESETVAAESFVERVPPVGRHLSHKFADYYETSN